MNNAKKWMVTLTDAQYDFIKQTSKEAGLKGSEVVRSLIEQCMQNNSKEFLQELKESRVKIRIEALREKRATLEEEIKTLASTVNHRQRVAVA